MFWNTNKKNRDLNPAMVELGRDVERGLLLLGAVIEHHWITKENDYAKAVSSMMDIILKDKTLTNSDRLEWIKLSRDLCKIRASEASAIEAHIDTDELIPKLVIRNRGDSEQEITEEEKNQFAHLCATYGSKRQIAYEAEKKIEPMRSNLAESMFGKLGDYMNGGSYSILLKG